MRLNTSEGLIWMRRTGGACLDVSGYVRFSMEAIVVCGYAALSDGKCQTLLTFRVI